MSVPWYLMAKGKGGGGYKTASGPIVSINDALAAPLRSLLVNIDPVQDLHGYGSPWPAGGGVNKFDLAAYFTEGEEIEQNGVTAKYSNGYLKVTGTNNTSSVFNIVYKSISGTLGPGTYISPSAKMSIRASVDGGPNTNYASAFTAASSVSLVAFYVAVAANETMNKTIPMMIAGGSERQTTYAPYSNLCPISGWSAANLWWTGKNLFDTETAFADRPTIYSVDDGTINVLVSDGTGWANITPYPIKAGTYTLTRSNAAGSMDVRLSTENYGIGHTQSGASFTFTMVTDGFIKIKLCFNASDYPLATTAQLELSSTPSPYAPYTGTTIPVTFTEAGTVYGGVWDVVNGVLTVDRAEVDLGTLDWTYDSSRQYFRTNSFAGIITGKPYSAIICDQYATKAGVGQPNADCQIAQNSSGGLSTRMVNIKNTRYTDADTFTNELDGVKAVYELATPITVPLSDITISTLAGQNVLWADCGDVTLEYLSAGGANPDLMKLAVAFMGKK